MSTALSLTICRGEKWENNGEFTSAFFSIMCGRTHPLISCRHLDVALEPHQGINYEKNSAYEKESKGGVKRTRRNASQLFPRDGNTVPLSNKQNNECRSDVDRKKNSKVRLHEKGENKRHNSNATRKSRVKHEK